MLNLNHGEIDMIDFEKFKEDAKQLDVLGVIVTQNNENIGYYSIEKEFRRNIYSASKSYTSCAVGIAIKEGLLSLDEHLVDAFKEDLPENVSDNLKKATVRDLLTMHLGMDHGELMGVQRPLYKEKDWVKMSLAFPFVYQPDTKFVYNNVGPYLAGMLVQRRAGCNLVDYLMPRLFEPMNIHRPTWECDPLGNTFGAGGLMLTMSEFHKFGLMYLQQGNYNGKQIITNEWAMESTSWQGDNDRDEYGYGYLFWGGPHNTFRADGKFCQFSIICREKNAVITVFAQCRDSLSLKQVIFNDIYPQL